jgi:dienelactone hydrolase
MQNMLRTSIFRSILLLLFFCSYLTLHAEDEVSIERPKQIIEYFKSGNVEEIYKQFDSIMAVKLTPNRLAPIWKQLTANYGEFNGFGKQDTSTLSGNLIINTDLDFDKAIMNFMLAVDKSNDKISGIYLSEQERKDLDAKANELPAYIDTTKFYESDVIVKDVYDLKGKLSVPNKFKEKIVFILVHGSGPNDMDETIGKNKFFKNLAWGLATDGYAVLRYNKLTYQYGNQFKKDSKMTQKDEYSNSIKGAIDLVRSNTATKGAKIVLIGHSQGASAITDFADDKSIDGLILLSGTPRKIYDVYGEQLEYIFGLDGSLTDAEKNMIAEHKEKIDYYSSHKKLKNVAISSDSLPLGLNYEYLLYLDKFDPIKNLSKSKKPTLIVGGGHDYQIKKTDFDAWKSGLDKKKNVEFNFIDNVNHIYGITEKMSVPADYNKHLPITPELFKVIDNWLKGNF